MGKLKKNRAKDSDYGRKYGKGKKTGYPVVIIGSRLQSLSELMNAF